MSDPGKTPETSAEAFALASSMKSDLSEKLASFRQYAKHFSPEIAAAYDRLIAHLDALDAGKVGPSVGDRMPDFLLPDQHGQLVSLESLLTAGPLVIRMNRGHWCPYCKLDLRALAEAEPDICRLGGQIVSIMPEKAQFTKQAIADNQVPFRILSDVDLGYALSLGLIFWVGAEVERLFAARGLDLERFQGNRNHFLPMAATFVIDRDGIVRAREVNVDYRQRMEPRAIVDVLASL